MSLHIAILGILCEGNHHPYDIKKLLKNMNLENIPHLNDGSLYYNFENLRKKGYVEKLEVTRDENRPHKTTYGITALGREALEQEIYESFKTFTSVKELYASAYFLKYANATKAAFLLEESIRQQEESLRHSRLLWKHAQEGDSSAIRIDTAIRLIYDHATSQKQMDIDWLRRLLAYVHTLEKASQV